MKVLLFSSLSPNSVRSGHAIFVETRLRELLKSGWGCKPMWRQYNPPSRLWRERFSQGVQHTLEQLNLIWLGNARRVVAIAETLR